MSEIGAFDAKTHFSQLLARVAQGEAFTITHRGTPIARLAPIPPASDDTPAREAFARLRARAAALPQTPFDWEEWRELRDAGRR